MNMCSIIFHLTYRQRLLNLQTKKAKLKKRKRKRHYFGLKFSEMGFQDPSFFSGENRGDLNFIFQMHALRAD